MLEQNGGQGIFICLEIPNLFALLYADDVLSVANSVLQQLKKTYVFENVCKSSGIEVNLNKTEIIVFRQRWRLKAKNGISKKKELKL